MARLVDQPIVHATLVRSSAVRAYDAIATAEGWNSWFTTGTTMDSRPGGHILFRWEDFGADSITAEEEGRVVEAMRPTRFAFQWHPDNRSYATTVEIDFEPVNEGTIIRLKETGYQDTPSGRKTLLDCAAGWGEALTLLKFYLEHGVRY